jgi:8-oxo-dGTP pyrophosphatase MutT (NUDIX family)
MSPATVAPAPAGGAAVLIVLVPARGRDGRTGDDRDGVPDEGPGVAEALASSVLLIRRAGHLRANPGEIAFPGGRVERGESPLAAALREAEEEVALAPGAVDILGELPTVLAARRDVPIRPFVAVASCLPQLRANPDEVDCVMLVPLSELSAPGRYWQEHWGRADDPTRVMHFFDLGEDLIWGATARMLYELFVRMSAERDGGQLEG